MPGIQVWETMACLLIIITSKNSIPQKVASSAHNSNNCVSTLIWSLFMGSKTALCKLLISLHRILKRCELESIFN